MRWLEHLTGRKPGYQTPKRDIKASTMDPAMVHPAPVDPTLESAARETSIRVHEKAREIETLSREIVEMTNGLLKTFEAKSNEKQNNS